MKFAPQFPSWKSIAETMALIGAVMGGFETSRNPRLGTTLVIAAIILFGASKFLRPKNSKSAVKTENYHIT